MLLRQIGLRAVIHIVDIQALFCAGLEMAESHRKMKRLLAIQSPMQVVWLWLEWEADVAQV
jgi:hypothetical protein